MAETHSIRSGRYLPEELQARILIRLGVKVLVRFELVCKTWQSLFRSRHFIKLYGDRVRSSLVCNKTTRMDAAMLTRISYIMKIAPQLYDLGLPDLLRKIYSKELGMVLNVLGPLNNGIYCLTSHVYDSYRANWVSIWTGKIAFCNLGIRCFRFANPFPSDIGCFLSEIKTYWLHFGFGSVAVNPEGDLDYKAIMIAVDLFDKHYSFVYSLKSGEWKMIAGNGISTDEKLTIHEPKEVCAQRFFQGCWHWMASNAERDLFLLSFNFGDETFNRINGPPYSIRAMENIESGVFVLHGHLTVVYINRTYNLCTEINVWMLMEYGVQDSWRKIYTLNPNCHGDFDTLIGVFSRSGSDEIESVCIGTSDLKSFECSKQGNKASNFPHLSSTCYWNTPGVSTYMESMEQL